MSEEQELKSVWDGWERQVKGIYGNDEKGHCALGWAYFKGGRSPFDDPEIARVATYIRNHMCPPAGLMTSNGPLLPRNIASHTIVWANDIAGATPEDFRRMDRCSQIEEMKAKLSE